MRFYILCVWVCVWISFFCCFRCRLSFYFISFSFHWNESSNADGRRKSEFIANFNGGKNNGWFCTNFVRKISFYFHVASFVEILPWKVLLEKCEHWTLNTHLDILFSSISFVVFFLSLHFFSLSYVSIFNRQTRNAEKKKQSTKRKITWQCLEGYNLLRIRCMSCSLAPFLLFN